MSSWRPIGTLFALQRRTYEVRDLPPILRARVIRKIAAARKIKENNMRGVTPPHSELVSGGQRCSLGTRRGAMFAANLDMAY